MKRPYYSLIAVFLGVLSSQIADAHFIWGTAEGGVVRFDLADEPGETEAPMPMYVKAPQLIGLHDLQPTADKNHMTASLSSTQKAGALGYQYGVFRESLVYWTAKVAPNLDSASKPLGLQGEILVKSSGGKLVATVLKNGHPVGRMDVMVTFGKTKPQMIKTDANGRLTLPKGNGQVYIGADIHENAAGGFKGTHYDTKDTLTTLSFRA